jgi:hypothetical protein
VDAVAISVEDEAVHYVFERLKLLLCEQRQNRPNDLLTPFDLIYFIFLVRQERPDRRPHDGLDLRLQGEKLRSPIETFV